MNLRPSIVVFAGELGASVAPIFESALGTCAPAIARIHTALRDTYDARLQKSSQAFDLFTAQSLQVLAEQGLIGGGMLASIPVLIICGAAESEVISPIVKAIVAAAQQEYGRGGKLRFTVITLSPPQAMAAKEISAQLFAQFEGIQNEQSQPFVPGIFILCSQWRGAPITEPQLLWKIVARIALLLTVSNYDVSRSAFSRFWNEKISGNAYFVGLSAYRAAWQQPAAEFLLYRTAIRRLKTLLAHPESVGPLLASELCSAAVSKMLHSVPSDKGLQPGCPDWNLITDNCRHYIVEDLLRTMVPHARSVPQLRALVERLRDEVRPSQSQAAVTTGTAMLLSMLGLQEKAIIAILGVALVALLAWVALRRRPPPIDHSQVVPSVAGDLPFATAAVPKNEILARVLDELSGELKGLEIDRGSEAEEQAKSNASEQGDAESLGHACCLGTDLLPFCETRIDAFNSKTAEQQADIALAEAKADAIDLVFSNALNGSKWLNPRTAARLAEIHQQASVRVREALRREFFDTAFRNEHRRTEDAGLVQEVLFAPVMESLTPESFSFLPVGSGAEDEDSIMKHETSLFHDVVHFLYLVKQP